MKKVITDNGLNLINQTRADGTTQYWIGYYGLAYVPDETRDNDPITASMTQLTKTGDNIYNIFQGSMTPVGFDTDIGDSAAYRLFNECMYTANIAQKFRYVLDENGNNQLIVFADAANLTADQSAGLVEYQRYKGVQYDPQNNDELNASELPIPAPLYYLGEPVDYNVTAEQADRAMNAVTVSCDTRVYKGNATTQPPSVQTETNAWASNSDKYSWADSKGNTYDDQVSTSNNFKYLKRYWQYQSVSNFNRFHAPANSAGYFVDSEPACRNLAKATRLFPISHYDVINAKDDEKVDSVKYTISLDLGDMLAKTTNRSTKYYQPSDGNTTLAETSGDNYRMGVKFNRIGIYAVPVSLRVFDDDAVGSSNCGDHNIQMQISGNEDPILFAVMDLPSPIVLSEDGLQKYVFHFQVQMKGGNVVDDASIYYNLYENDAITWYKNQLIANASTAEAVTSLGVQMAYLRQQINDMNSGSDACGIGDDGDRYALEGHTHDYMKNIVDSQGAGNGAVRGIYTKEEGRPIKIYQIAGRGVQFDEVTQTLRYTDDNTPVPLLINSASYMSGKDSMTLGSDSATIGSYSINMSDYGILGQDSKSVLLMGGRGKSGDYDDFHLAVDNTRNSIINIEHGEIRSMRGSIWLGDVQNICSGNVLHTIGVGKNDVTDNRFNPYSNIEGVHSGSSSYNVLVGYNRLMGYLQRSVIVGIDESGSQQNIAMYNPFADMDAEYMKYVNYVSERSKLFPTQRRGVEDVVSAGYRIDFGTGLSASLVIGKDLDGLVGTANSIMVGSRQNNAQPYYNPDIVLTVDEFNARYGTAGTEPYPDDDPIWYSHDIGDIMVVGDGTLSFRDGVGSSSSVKTRDVKGITLYITYTNNEWTTGVTIGRNRDNPDDPTIFGEGYRAKMYADLYSRPGHNKNMVMLGDDINVGYGSESSIVMGDYSGTRKITVKNSFINFLGDQTAFDANSTDGPCSTFDNVWWIGHAKSKDSISTTHCTGHIVGAQADSKYDSGVYRDRFVFIGENDNAFAHSYWYGMADDNRPKDIVKLPNSLEWEYSYQDVYQTTKSPMIYTGGIALGGYGVEECNFMLLKVGYSRGASSFVDPAMVAINVTEGINTTPNLSTPDTTVGKIIRSNKLCGPWTEGADNTTTSYILHPYKEKVGVLAAGSTSLEANIEPTGYTLKEIVSAKFVIRVLNSPSNSEPIATVDATWATTNLVWATLDAPYSVAYDYYIEANIEYSDAVTVYDYFDDTRDAAHHFMVDCPYKGMSLVVQDKQELDGTLHVGLGMANVHEYGNTRYLSIACQYISDNYTLHVSGNMSGSLKLDCTFDSATQQLNTDYRVYDTLDGLKLYGYVRYTQEGAGTEPCPPVTGSSTPIVCHLSNVHLFIPMDKGYLVDMFKLTDSGGQNIDYGDRSDNWIMFTGGSMLIPSYLSIRNMNEMFPEFVHITAQLQQYYIGNTDPHKIGFTANHMYKFTPVEWRRGDGSIVTSSYDSSETTYITRYEDWSADRIAVEGLTLEGIS